MLVTGGCGYRCLHSYASAEIYDPVTGLWSVTGSMSTAREGATATLLPNGKVLVAGGVPNSNGGYGVSTAEIYDPATGSWSATGSMHFARVNHTATLLRTNGKVLVAGGANAGSALESTELYDPSSGSWTQAGTLITGRYAHIQTQLPNGDVLVAGGQTISGMTNTAERFDPASGTWRATGSMSVARAGFGAILLPSGQVLVTGGSIPTSWTNSSELYTP